MHFWTRAMGFVLLCGCQEPRLGPGDSNLNAIPNTPGEQGAALFQELNCSGCHGAGGIGSQGPALKGLFGRLVELTDGTSVMADAAYLKESITNPSAKVVKGYGLGMPSFNHLSSEQVNALVEYIQALQ